MMRMMLHASTWDYNGYDYDVPVTGMAMSVKIGGSSIEMGVGCYAF